MSCETTGSTLSPIMWLTQKGAIPSPATQTMRQITATRSSHNGQCTVEYVVVLERTYEDSHFGNEPA